MANANESVLNYLAAWNERDAKRRLELVAKAWTEDGSYVDPAREGKGHQAISDMIGEALSHFPGYSLTLASGIDAHHDHVRFSWIAGGTTPAQLYLKGTDVAQFDRDGRFKAVVGFVEASPAH